MGIEALGEWLVGLSWTQIIPSGAITAVIGAVWGWRKERSRHSEDLRERIRLLVQASRSDLTDAELRWENVYGRVAHSLVQMSEKPMMLSQLRKIQKEVFETPRAAADEIHGILHEEGRISIKQLESTHRRIRKVYDDQVLSLKRFNAQMDGFERKLKNPLMPWIR
ncbi:hypothetical protein [Pseudomonas oryzihabitans]|uniref:Uncharacterized protein n=1 Tax=Pseudomonas oryzihabitans TaxID=47885 RepID=A0A178LCC7_9PSED|nr:hypothetical protein [Pseudomonas oryzihabitans]OAN27118.1 hypothetical protein A4V15_22085 [Pseudomonas oryzihabitans]